MALLPYVYGFVHKNVLERIVSSETELRTALVQMALLPEQRDFIRAKPKEHIHPLVQWDMILTQLEQLDRVDLLVFSEGAIPNGLSKAWVTYSAVETIWQRHFGEEAIANFPPKRPPFAEEKRVSNAFWIKAVANHFHARVIVGLDDREEGCLYNSAVHCCSHNLEINKYRKQILIPVGEYIPFSNWTWFKRFVMETFAMGDGFSSGQEPAIFSGDVPIGVNICLEETYSHLVRKIRQKGAKLFVNLTNDVWFPKTRLPWHHFDHGRVRSVENGVCTLRATNTGVTAVVDCFGDTLAMFPTSMEASGVLVTPLKVRSYATLYTFWGDTPILVLSSLFFGLLWVDRGWRKKTLL